MIRFIKLFYFTGIGRVTKIISGEKAACIEWIIVCIHDLFMFLIENKPLLHMQSHLHLMLDLLFVCF